jgi:hypothetical protein
MRLLGAKGWMKFALMAFIGAGAASAAYGDNFVVTYEPAGVETPYVTALCAGTSTAGSTCWVGEEQFLSTETFKSGQSNAATFQNLSKVGVTTGAITGSYTQGLVLTNADQYGGAGGTGDYAEVKNNSTYTSYTLTLNTSGSLTGVNYFGLWFSALDAGNDLKFYDGSTLEYDFTPAKFMSLVGTCPTANGVTNAFCGNPSDKYNDSNEQFAFLNFFDEGGDITSIVFTETSAAGSGAGFESDNQTVGYINPITLTGTVIGDAPEPGTFVLLSIGALAFVLFRRRLALKGMN